jgi:hypothetical protein
MEANEEERVFIIFQDSKKMENFLVKSRCRVSCVYRRMNSRMLFATKRLAKIAEEEFGARIEKKNPDKRKYEKKE